MQLRAIITFVLHTLITAYLFPSASLLRYVAGVVHSIVLVIFLIFSHINQMGILKSNVMHSNTNKSSYARRIIIAFVSYSHKTCWLLMSVALC